MADLQGSGLDTGPSPSMLGIAAQVLENLPDAFISIGRDWKVTYTNKVAVEHFGQLVGKDAWGVWPHDRGTLYEEVGRRVMESRSPERFVGYRAETDRWIENHLVPHEEGIGIFYRDVTETVKAEQALREQASLLDSTFDGVFIQDLDGIIEYWNKGSEWLYGYTRGEAVGQLAQTLLQTVASEPLAITKEKLQKKGVWEGELIHTCKDGSLKTVLSRWVRHHTVAGTSNILQVDRDITERKRFMEEIRKERAMLAAVVETAVDSIVTIDTYGTIHSANSAVERLFGYTQAELIGQNVRLLMPSPYHEEHDGYLKSYRETGRRKIIGIGREVFGRRKDGTSIPIELSVSETNLASGPIFTGFIRDITARKEAQEAIETSESRYRALTEAMTEVVWVANATGQFDSPQPDWEDFTGQPWPEYCGGSEVAMYHPDDRSEVATRWTMAVQRKMLFETTTRLWSRKHGGYRHVIARAVPVFDENGKVREWAGTMTDVTEQREAQLAIQEANERLQDAVKERTAELEAANREMEGFTYSVSHDLRAPLRAIGATSRLLREDFGDVLPLDAHNLLERQNAAAVKLGMLIDELLQLSRLTRQEMTPKPFNLGEIAGDIAADLEARPQPAPIRFKVEPNMPAYGDPTLIRFVLLNLMENAVKFSPKGGEVVVGHQKSTFFVRDQGIGFDLKYEHKLWRPFERLVTEREFPGTGIGLANVYRIIHKHGGRVWAESEPGKGSTFFFTLS